MNICFGIRVADGDDFLGECLECIYPFAYKIIIAEGSDEEYRRAHCRLSPRSTDGTNRIIDTFPDPQRKIIAVRNEKAYRDGTEQCNEILRWMPADTDYLWMVDSDELYRPEDIEKMTCEIDRNRYTYVAVNRHTFFKNIHTLAVGGEGWGFDVAAPRIFKYASGVIFSNHRPYALCGPDGAPLVNINPFMRSADMGVWCFHYAYVTEKQVYAKLIYRQAINKRDYLESWYRNVWIDWSEKSKSAVERSFSIHPDAPGAKTLPYEGAHPACIVRKYETLGSEEAGGEQAEQIFEDAIEYHRRGEPAKAQSLYQAALALNCGNAYGRYLLGKVMDAQGDTAEAIACFRRAAALNPNNPDFILALAGALQKARAYDDAARQYKRALSLKPDSAEAYVRLGDLFRTIGRFDGAERSYRMALRFDSRNVQAHTNIGNIFRMKGRYTEAIACYGQALLIRPDFPKTLNNLALCLTDQGDLEEARKTYRNALEKEPALAELRSNYLFCLCYDPDMNYAALYEEHKRFGTLHGAEPSGARGTCDVNREPNRRLRIGFVSPDFRRHSVSFFFEPLLANLDRNIFETTCYSQVEFDDSVTERLRGMSGQWRDIRELDDERCVELIHRDGIDILVDLAGHTGGNRLTVFGRKAAPVQATYLGYPCTTGLAQIDYRITDGIADPEGEDAFYTERLVRLSGCFLCYMPPDDAPPAGESQQAAGRSVTLGSFNTLPKLNGRLIRLWSEVLHACPGARLLLKRRALDDPGTRERIHAMFAANGIVPQRLELEGHVDSSRNHLEQYNRVDICLDTFPYNGTTTTCEALWMGVPVVTLAGKHHVQRVSASILHTAGLDELAVNNERGYVELVCALARDADRRAAMRACMRERMAKSELSDGRAFARKFEKALMEMWLRACP